MHLDVQEMLKTKYHISIILNQHGGMFNRIVNCSLRLLTTCRGQILCKTNYTIDNLLIWQRSSKSNISSVLRQTMRIWRKSSKPESAKASSVYGCQQQIVQKSHGKRLKTKIKLYKTTVLAKTLANIWTYPNLNMLKFSALHVRHLMEATLWVSKGKKEHENEVLWSGNMDGIEALLIRDK